MKVNLLTRLTLAGALFFMIQSCGYIVTEVVAPNTCKKCDILAGSSVVETRDECGGGVYNMEMKMKARAYDLGPNYYLECETYKLE